LVVVDSQIVAAVCRQWRHRVSSWQRRRTCDHDGEFTFHSTKRNGCCTSHSRRFCYFDSRHHRLYSLPCR